MYLRKNLFIFTISLRTIILSIYSYDISYGIKRIYATGDIQDDLGYRNFVKNVMLIRW